MHRLNCRMTRREMLTLCRNGFGSLAFMGLAGASLAACKPGERVMESAFSDPLFLPHYAPKAKSVIFLYMDGGVSQVDSFDPKPRLDREHGESPYDKFKVDDTQFNNIGKILKSPWSFKQYGECGMPVSELFPHIATCVDDLALVRSMVSQFPEHTNANYFLHTGIGIQDDPAWGRG